MQDIFSTKSIDLMLIVAASTAIIYVYLILLIRFIGRHTLSQLSALDLLIVILLGSSVETSMVHGSTLLRCGFVSAVVLFVMNWLLNFGMLRSKRFKNLVGGGPTILVSNGQFVEENLIKAGLTKADVAEALREREFGDIAEVRLAVMEPDGQVNVLSKSEPDGATSPAPA
jgi:uncharacterized membrane protein YcaP (DUF421 family)